MHRVKSCAIALAIGAIWLALARAEEQAPAEPGAENLAFLAGRWKGTFDHGEWEAVYTSPCGGELLSANKELRDGRVVMIEFEHFRMVDGKLVLTPFPHGKRSNASFALTHFDPKARRAVFANPEHDFPSQIVYHRAAEDRLVIEVSGAQDGRPTRLMLDLRKQD